MVLFCLLLLIRYLYFQFQLKVMRSNLSRFGIFGRDSGLEKLPAQNLYAFRT